MSRSYDVQIRTVCTTEEVALTPPYTLVGKGGGQCYYIEAIISHAFQAYRPFQRPIVGSTSPADLHWNLEAWSNVFRFIVCLFVFSPAGSVHPCWRSAGCLVPGSYSSISFCPYPHPYRIRKKKKKKNRFHSICWYVSMPPYPHPSTPVICHQHT